MYPNALPLFDHIPMLWICSKPLFYTRYVFAVVVVMTFEAEGWPSRILASSTNAPQRSTAFQLYSNAPDMFFNLSFILGISLQL
jgi:hypothetical protein